MHLPQMDAAQPDFFAFAATLRGAHSGAPAPYLQPFLLGTAWYQCPFSALSLSQAIVRKQPRAPHAGRTCLVGARGAVQCMHDASADLPMAAPSLAICRARELPC